jgi:hypothetical protein
VLSNLRRLLRLLTIFLLSPSFLGQQTTVHEPPKSLVVVPAASNIERFYGGSWFSEGCDRLIYNVTAPYPGSTVVKFISDELKRQGLLRQPDLGGKPVSMHGVAKKFGAWERWNNTRGKTYLRTEQWRTQAGDVVKYSLWYFTPDMKGLQVDAEYCSAAFVKKRECLPGPAIAHDEKAYSIAMNIKKVEPVIADFKVSVEIENNGDKPILLGVNGELSDGSPELWVLGVEQEGADGEWDSVDAVCAEHGPLDWITLKPGEKVHSWALAVEFPEPNHRFAKCRRKIAHLHGRIRAAIRYYADVCEIEERFDNKAPYFGNSEPVELPRSKK